MSLRDVLNNVLGLKTTTDYVGQRLTQFPQIISGNFDSRMQAAQSSLTRPYGPPSLANADSYLALNGGLDGYLVVKKVVVTSPTGRGGADDNDTTKTTLEVGTIVKRGNNRLPNKANQPLTQPFDEYMNNNLAALADFTGDGTTDFGYFEGEDGQLWVPTEGPGHYLVDQFKTPTSAAQYSRLPSNFISNNSNKYAFSTGDGKWIVVQKPYRTFDNINPYGNHPLYGYNNSIFANFQTVYGPYGIYSAQTFNDPTKFNQMNPFQFRFDQQNWINSYSTEKTVTYMRAVPDTTLNSNQQLQTIKNWLQAGATFQGGRVDEDANGNPVFTPATLSGHGPFAVKYDDDGDPASPEKHVVAAYVNPKGELVIEYA